jgi:nitrate/TMAO reductase-like tetraheme cytochrome c subunit
MAVFDRIRNHRFVMAAWARLAGHWRAALVVCVLLASIAAVAGFRAFHYVEHDNRFCLSCHIMADPFARFSRSAHSKIECHDCHKATTGEKLHQVYATLVHNQSHIEKHAHVPNEVCEACHVRGDSARWRQIAATAGHRVHLQSRDSALRGVQCVMCHGGTELHAFASVETTCGRAGCHANQHVRLGRMADLQIYCATCHDFLARTTNVRLDSAGRPMSPQARQCLSCHAMQARLGAMEIAADPHRGQCGLCHDPHKQTTAKAAVKSCTSGSCHVGIDTIPFHRGVPHADQCAACHAAHSFRVEGANCTRCHRNIQQEPPTHRLAQGREPQAPMKEWGKRPAADSAAGVLQRPRFPRFSHGDHRSERCASCHDSSARHGQLKFATDAGCQGCHHTGPAREDCVICHRSVRTGPARPLAFALTVTNRSVSRQVRFAHAPHARVQCSRCHAATPDRAPSRADCSGCHADHHGAAVTCSGCHQGSAAIVADHKLADHATCATGSCHGLRAADLPSTRAMCLTCHSAQQTHRPGRVCNECHRVRAS